MTPTMQGGHRKDKRLGATKKDKITQNGKRASGSLGGGGLGSKLETTKKEGCILYHFIGQGGSLEHHIKKISGSK